MSKGAIKIPYRPIQENEKPLADRAYRESRRTAIAMYVMAAVFLWRSYYSSSANLSRTIRQKSLLLKSSENMSMIMKIENNMRSIA